MVHCEKEFLESMLSRKSGHIMNITSFAARFGVAGLSAYCVSKFALLGFSESLHHKLARIGLRVTVVSSIGSGPSF